MNIKIAALFFIPLLLLPLTFTSVASYMKDNPLNLSSELALTNEFPPEIEHFWQQHAQSHYFQGVDNKTLHSISITNSNNKAIVISQGRNESVLKYKETAYDLHQQGYDVFLIDHRGQGFSERFGGDQYRGYVENFQDYVDDLNLYVTALELDKKYTHRYLLSHSMGGAISALYLQQYQTPFHASVFFSPMFAINLGPVPAFVIKIIAYSSAEVCRWFTNKACYVPGGKGYMASQFEGNHLTSSQARFYASQSGFQAFPETQLGDATMRWVATSISATERAIKEAKKIDMPVLIVQADNDDIVKNSGQSAFFDNLPPCQSNNLVVIKEAKHEILLEHDEARFSALTHALQFLSQAQKGHCTS